MNIKKIGFYIIGVVLVLSLSVGLSWVYVQSQLKLTTLYVASHSLEARIQLEESDLKAIQIPKNYVLDGVILNKEDILDHYVSIQGIIPKGSFFYEGMLDSIESAKDAPSLRLYENQAIYALDVSLTTTAGNTLRVNQKVDIYGTVKSNKTILADRLLAHVRIVGLKDKNGEDITDKSTSLPKVLLLAVYRDYIPWLAKLEALGSLSLSPTAYPSSEEECVAETQTELWNLLYVQ